MRVIVTTSLKYAHIIPTFVQAFLRAWPGCPWPVQVLYSGEQREYPHLPQGWSTHVTNDLGWTSSLLGFLGYSDEPFLLLLDDYILDAVDKGLLYHAAQWMTTPAIGMVRVHPCPGPTLAWPWRTGKPYKFGEIDKAEPYAISLQAAIWQPQVCRDLFIPTENPWQTEIDGSKRAKGYDRFTFIGTVESAVGYRELMKRGAEIPETRAWVDANLGKDVGPGLLHQTPLRPA